MGRGSALLSAFPRDMLKKLATPEIMEFLVRQKMLNRMQQALLTLAAVADDAEEKLFATARSARRDVMEWLCNFQDIMYSLEELLDEFSSGEEESDADAKPTVNFILRRFEIITKQKHLLFRTEKQGEQQRPSLTIYGRDKEKNEMVDFLLSDRATGGNISVLAIVGVAGIGKTTLAAVVYDDDRVKACFELRCWVEFRQELDAESLAKIILDRFHAYFHYDDSLPELMHRLRKCLDGKKFLLMLDDCRDFEGWESLRACFADVAGRGSAVILTTPRVEVSSKMPADQVLHLGLLSLEDSCSLFSELAFGNGNLHSHPQLVSVAKEIVRKVGGLPLAAKKLGSVLYEYQDYGQWAKLLKIKRSELLDLNLPLQFPTKSCFDNLVHLEIIGARMAELPNGIGELRYLEYLDLSFSAIRTLPESMSAMSCLQTMKLSFCRYLKELPSNLVDLISLRYLDITGTNLREMPLHMGRLKNLQKLSGFIVCVNGSNVAELAGISNIRTLSITELQNMVHATYALEANLREKGCLDNLMLRWNQLLQFQQHVPDYEHALTSMEPPKQLKMLEILGYPGRKFPDWLGDASLRTLEVLHLRDCRNCYFLPPLGQLPSLKVLFIQGCDNVRSIGTEFYGLTTSHVPFKSLETLKFVDMLNWREWILLDVESLQFPCLRELYLIHCPELVQDLPKHLPSLERLEISECDRLVASLPKIPDNHELMVQEEQDCNEILMTKAAEVTSESSLHHAETEVEGTTIFAPVTNRKTDELISDRRDNDEGEASSSQDMLDFESSFEILKVTDASQLWSLPYRLKSLRMEGCQFLESLPDDFLSDCSDIFELFFIDCCSLKHFADALCPRSLRTLYIHKCRKLEFIIPLGIHRKFALLEHLYISSSCESLMSISINLFPSLRTLYIRDCPNLVSFSVAEGLRDQNLSLESLEIRDCPNLISFPREGLSTPNLISMSVSNCKNLKSLPNHMSTLSSLQSLLVDKCPEVESFPDGGLPSSLNLLSIAFSDKLAPHKEWKLQRLHSLSRFEIESGCIGVKSFPDRDFLPRNLKSLRISRLSSLRVLNGKGLQHLTALETLEIDCCHGLYSLPQEGLPASLTCLCIRESSILTRKLLYKAGEDWCKIAHIPNIQIDDGAEHGVKEGMHKIDPAKHKRNSRGETPKQHLWRRKIQQQHQGLSGHNLLEGSAADTKTGRETLKQKETPTGKALGYKF